MTTTLTPATAEFAAKVREALSDLPPDDLEDLTDGLEADLAERAEESGLDLGDPIAYAEELRAAAGFPPRSARQHVAGGIGASLRSFPTDIAREWRQLVAKHSLIRATLDFFIALRPVWWVLRGVAIYWLLSGLLGFSGLGAWPVGVVFVVLSVQIGRGWMRGRAWVRWTQRVLSGIAIIALPFIAGWTVSQVQLAHDYQYQDASYYDYGSGLTQNGQQVDNIFAYDAEGNPVDQVQLFDQNGQPLNLTSDTTQQWWNAQDGSMLVPSDDVPGRAGWNVFPLAHVNDWSDYEDDGQIDDSEVSQTEFPAKTVKPLAGHEGPSTPMTEVTPAPTPTPAG